MTEKVFFGVSTTEDIEKASALCQETGYRLIYEENRLCPWCIADEQGEILWCNYGLQKAIWRLKFRLSIN